MKKGRPNIHFNEKAEVEQKTTHSLSYTHIHKYNEHSNKTTIMVNSNGISIEKKSEITSTTKEKAKANKKTWIYPNVTLQERLVT